jgi:outer membrane autotransporter protein
MIGIGHVHLCCLFAWVGAVSLAASVATAQTTPVDVELSLGIDVSGSVSETEFDLMRDGYTNAFNNAAVLNAIQSGPIGGIAVNVIFFESNAFVGSGLDFALVNDAASRDAFVTAFDAIANKPDSGGTAPSTAINLGISEINSNAFSGARKVIDISGDGTGSDPATETARDNAASNGITINGIAIESESVRQWFEDHMITGSGSFASFADSFEDFEQAILDKLLIEITGQEEGTMSNIGDEAATQLQIARTVSNLQMTNNGYQRVRRRGGQQGSLILANDNRLLNDRPPENALAVMMDGPDGLTDMGTSSYGAVAAAMLNAPASDPAADDPNAHLDRKPTVFETGKVAGFAALRFTFGEQDFDVTRSEEDYFVVAGTFGLDRRFTDKFVGGIALGASHTDSDQPFDGELDIDAFTVALYGTYTPTPQWYVDGAISYSNLQFDLRRDVPGVANTFADSATEGHQLAIQGRTGYDLLHGNWVFGPMARVDYVGTWVEGYTEVNAGGFNATVDDQHADSLQHRLGGQVSYIWERGDRTIVPHVVLSWGHEYLDDARTVNASLASNPTVNIAIPSDDPDRDFVDLSAGVNASLGERVGVFAQYSTILGNTKYTSHTVSAGVRFTF